MEVIYKTQEYNGIIQKESALTLLFSYGIIIE